MTLGEKEIYPFKETLLRDLTFRRITTLKIKLIAKGLKKLNVQKYTYIKKNYITITKQPEIRKWSYFRLFNNSDHYNVPPVSQFSTEIKCTLYN